jgi:hypothetical protein
LYSATPPLATLARLAMLPPEVDLLFFRVAPAPNRKVRTTGTPLWN